MPRRIVVELTIFALYRSARRGTSKDTATRGSGCDNNVHTRWLLMVETGSQIFLIGQDW